MLSRVLNKKVIHPIFLLALTFLVWTFSDRFNLNPWWPSLVTFIIIAGFFYTLNKKYGDSEEIDNLVKNIFNSNLKSKLILSIIFFLIGLFLLFVPKNGESYKEKFSARYFGGLVWNGNGEPLPSVVITLPELNLVDTTDILGKFYFELFDTNYTTLTVIAYKDGYSTYEGDGSVGNLYYNFNMTKK